MVFNKSFKIIFLLSILFTLIIFFLKNFIFPEVLTTQEEEKYIDTTAQEEINLYLPNKYNVEINEDKIEDNKETILDKYIEKVKEGQEEEKNVFFIYIPSIFRNNSEEYTKVIKKSITDFYFENKIKDITIELYKNLVDVRWKMKNKKIKLFWLEHMWKDETFSVFIHELWHYIDLYHFSSNDIRDKSKYFYEISWSSTKVMKKWQTNKDFVSWYSMTNKYEDFAESFIYYILHNKDFLLKADNSPILNDKYLFFKKYLFNEDEFYLSNFWTNKEIKDYYRDITKIGINLENFLQYSKDKI